MSKMQEAFEKEHCGSNPNTTRKNSTTGEYVLPSVQDAWSGFQSGYQAAIAAVKEGGPVAKTTWYPSGNEVFFVNEDGVTHGELLYRIPEDV